VKTPPATFLAFCASMGLPPPVPEHRFHPERRWRFDYAWPDSKIALEVEGGTWIGGRHSTGAGMQADMAKYNEAAALGWRLIRRQPRQLLTLETALLIKRCRTS